MCVMLCIWWIGGGVALKVNNDEGMKRSWLFWQNVGPIYARYRYTEWLVKNEPEHLQDIAFNVRTTLTPHCNHIQCLAPLWISTNQTKLTLVVHMV
jgi:hypothetical protein